VPTVDFEFSPQEQAFAEEVDKWLVDHHDPVVMDPTRENFTQLVDTPERRAFMRKLAAQGWLGMTWPKEYGGKEMEGVYARS
jgi:alkylation response protein AidB-like acyl-CoA dehydrogenase